MIPDWAEKLERENVALKAEIEKLRAFKAYVHQRLDGARVPTNVDPVETLRTGCRIEGRLSWLIERAKPAVPLPHAHVFGDQDPAQRVRRCACGAVLDVFGEIYVP